VALLGGALPDVIIAESGNQADSRPDHFGPSGCGRIVVVHLWFRRSRHIFGLETMRMISTNARRLDYSKRNSRFSIPILNPLLRCPCEYCARDKRTRSEALFLEIDISRARTCF